MQTRRDIIKSGLGLAAIIAAGKAPAAIVRSMVAARSAAFTKSNTEEEMYKELYEMLCQGVDALVARKVPSKAISFATPLTIASYGVNSVPFGDYTFENVSGVGSIGLYGISSGAKIRLPNCTSIVNLSVYGCSNVEIFVPKMNHIVLNSANAICHWKDGDYKGDGTPIEA